MTWTLDRTTDVGRVRVLVTGEGVQATSVFTDEDIEVLLGINPDPLLAAAFALERIASDQVLLFRKIKVGTIELDGPAVAKGLLDLATRYRDAWGSYGDSGEGDILIAPMVLDRQGWRDRIWNEMLREMP